MQAERVGNNAEKFCWTAGKTGMGKSSTVNSILAEPVAQVVVMQAPASRAQAYSRTAAGFTLTLIDTPGVLEGDAVDGAVRTLLLSMVVESQEVLPGRRSRCLRRGAFDCTSPDFDVMPALTCLDYHHPGHAAQVQS
jgi:hypothetical protein